MKMYHIYLYKYADSLVAARQKCENNIVGHLPAAIVAQRQPHQHQHPAATVALRHPQTHQHQHPAAEAQHHPQTRQHQHLPAAIVAQRPIHLK